MSSRKLFSSLLAMWVAVPSLALFLSAGSARAQNSPANYTFLLASGLLCDPGDSATCPAIVKSANDDWYEMSGAGIFEAQSKSVTAAGTYAHKSSDGTVLETGVWIVSQLVSFDSYGPATGARMAGGRPLGPQSGPRRVPMFPGSMPTGGLAVFRIRLLPMSGAAKTAVLQANCALGNVPSERAVEGIRLILGTNGTEFSEEVSGRVLFLSVRAEVSRPADMPAQGPAPGSAESPSSPGQSR